MVFRKAFISTMVVALSGLFYVGGERSVNAQEPRSIESLLQDLNHPYPAVREQSVSSLAHLGGPAVEPLIAVLRRGAPVAQEHAAYALWLIKDPRAIEPLILATKSRAPEVRYRAVQALGVFQDSHVVKPLIAALRDKDLFVRRAAVEALGNQKDPNSLKPLMAIWLSDDDSMVIDGARAAIVNMGGPAVDDLIAALAVSDFRTQSSAADALARIGDPRAIGPLVAALGDGNPSVPTYVANALAQFGISAVEPLIAALQNQGLSDSALYPITQSLAKIGDTRAVDPLVAALKHKSVAARSGAARALGSFHDLHAVEPLIEALKSGESNVKAAAAKSLGQLKDARAVEPLILTLNDADSRVRLFAVQALWATAGADAADHLIPLAKDNEPMVRAAAFEALSKVNDARLYKMMLAGLKDELSGIQSRAEEWLVKIGIESVDDLIAILMVRDPAYEAREARRLEAIARLKDDPNAFSFFAVCGNEPPPLPSNPQQWAARALGKIGDTRAVEPLIGALIDERADLRFEAAKALVLIAHPNGGSYEELTRRLADADPAVRAEATLELKKALTTRPSTIPHAAVEPSNVESESHGVAALTIFTCAGLFVALIRLGLKPRGNTQR